MTSSFGGEGISQMMSFLSFFLNDDCFMTRILKYNDSLMDDSNNHENHARNWICLAIVVSSI